MLSDVQLAAVEKAKALLLSAGLKSDFEVQPTWTLQTPALLPSSLSTCTHDQPLSLSPATQAPSAIYSAYQAPAARPFTEEELSMEMHIINRQLQANALVDHPLGAVVEYPESNSATSVIAHRFAINPQQLSDHHPKSNVQYSMGGFHGAENDVYCGKLLCDNNDRAVYCQKVKTSCSYL